MEIADPRIRTEVIHGQIVHFPSLEAWSEIIRDAALGDIALPIPDWIKRWLDEYGQFHVAHLGLVHKPHHIGWLVVPMLRLDGRYYRVHYEDVICEHCDRRCGASATPDSVSYAGTSVDPQKVWDEFNELPLQSCPYCHGMLRRRQTVWLASQPAA
ncbi:hypothetical protein [Pseudoduganella sp. R-34]|uniref:hypothetical protein n=1 Tax=unclassified Pseudoduganella TaxID=2637179 RepID=UPI003CF572A5